MDSSFFIVLGKAFIAFIACIAFAVIAFVFGWLVFALFEHLASRFEHDYTADAPDEADECEVCGAPVKDFFVMCSRCTDSLCHDCADPVPGTAAQYHCPSCAIEAQKLREIDSAAETLRLDEHDARRFIQPCAD